MMMMMTLELDGCNDGIFPFWIEKVLLICHYRRTMTIRFDSIRLMLTGTVQVFIHWSRFDLHREKVVLTSVQYSTANETVAYVHKTKIDSNQTRMSHI